MNNSYIYFNNRELAIVIWLVAFMLYCSFSSKMKDARKVFTKFIKIFFTKPILYTFVILFIYLLLEIAALYKMGIWQFTNFKCTIMWVGTISVLSIYKIIKEKNTDKFYSNLLIDNIKVTAFIQFIIGLYSFNILIEIIIVPVIVLLSILLGISVSDEKYSTVAKFINWIFVLYGIIAITYSAYNIAINYERIALIQTVGDFYISPILTFFYIPFIFLIKIHSVYELIHIRLKYLIKNKNLISYAKKRSMLSFNFNTKLLERWARILPFQDTSTIDGVNKSIKEIFRMVASEKIPKMFQ